MTTGTELLKLLPAAVYMTDAEGRLTFYNQAAAELWGYRPDLGTAKWCGSWRLYWADGRPMAHNECPMAVALMEGRPVRGAEAIAERPDGTRVRFAPYPTPLTDADGKVIGAINLLVDITERHHSDLESAKLAAIVTASDDAIVSKTIEGRITSWNPAATRLLGYEASEIIGKPILTIIPPELHHEEKEIIAQLRRGEYIKHYETVRVTKDGRRIDLSLSLSPLRDKFGKVVGAAKIARDITERKRAEALQQLLLEELNHRVKNTLATVQAFAAQTLNSAKDPVHFVESFTGRIQALASAHTLLTRTTWTGAELGTLIRAQLAAGCDVEGDRLVCSGPEVILDPQLAVHLGLALHELCVNAVKYGALSVPEGRLTVSWTLVKSETSTELKLDWIESGGPPVASPASRGFGTVLVEHGLTHIGAGVKLGFPATGVICEIVLPITERSRPASNGRQDD